MFEIKEATRRIIPVLALCGISGSGKTYSALLFARGYAGSENKICIIDTEYGRSEAYAGLQEIGKFDVLSLKPPFSPERYVEAYRQASAHVGSDGVVIIDSSSHEWEGIGGILDMAEQEERKMGKKDMRSWVKPKIAHRKFVHEITNPTCCTILCLRIKEVLKPIKGGSPETVQEIVAEKNFKYDLTTVFEISPNDHTVTVSKAPKPMQSLTPIGQRIQPIDSIFGQNYASFIRGGETKTHDSDDEIQVKIAACEDLNELTGLYRQYEKSKHPELKKIAAWCAGMKKALEQQVQHALTGGEPQLTE
jgi:hypothetical protein